jgi:hypothetical protein
MHITALKDRNTFAKAIDVLQVWLDIETNGGFVGG